MTTCFRVSVNFSYEGNIFDMALQLNTEKILYEYLNGLSIRQIAVKHNCCPMTIYRKISPYDEYQQAARRPQAFNLKRAVALRSQKYTYDEIASILNVSNSTVRRHLKNRGVTNEKATL